MVAILRFRLWRPWRLRSKTSLGLCAVAARVEDASEGSYGWSLATQPGSWALVAVCHVLVLRLKAFSTFFCDGDCPPAPPPPLVHRPRSFNQLLAMVNGSFLAVSGSPHGSCTQRARRPACKSTPFTMRPPSLVCASGHTAPQASLTSTSASLWTFLAFSRHSMRACKSHPQQQRGARPKQSIKRSEELV